MISSLRKQLLVQQGSSRSEENIEEMETLRVGRDFNLETSASPGY